MAAITSLPPFPSTRSLRKLSPSQYANVVDQISATLSQVLSIAPEKLQNMHRQFVASYVRDGACEVLYNLVFPEGDDGTNALSRKEALIRGKVFALAERFVSAPKAGGIDLQILLDFCIVYGPRNVTRVRKLIELAIKSSPSIIKDISEQCIPTFIRMLDSTEFGLHGLRKTSFCVLAILQCATPDVLQLFAANKDFVLVLARCYGSRLSSIASSYGAFNLNQTLPLDESAWEKLWLESKVALFDCFHLILQHTLHGLTKDNDVAVDSILELMFTLLELPSPGSSQNLAANLTPFLDRPLIADYESAFSLSSKLSSSLANRDDARLDMLIAQLKSFDQSGDKQGALRLLSKSGNSFHGSNTQVAISAQAKGKGKARAPTPVDESGLDDDLAMSQVLDIFPDQSPQYIRSLLALPAYAGDAERVVAALLEGSIPSAESLQESSSHPAPALMAPVESDPWKYTKDRRNIFDDQPMELANVTIGKKRMDTETLLADRSFADQMKSNILRRAEDIWDEDDEMMGDEDIAFDERGRKMRIVAFTDDDTDSVPVKPTTGRGGDGEYSEDESTDEDGPSPKSNPTLELAYLRDPKLFDRDASTRRSKARADLKAQTGWDNEQIEGWKIMLERDPKKDQILQKHEFSGNRPLQPSSSESDLTPSGSREGGGGRGGRGSGHRGRGRGGAGGGDAKDRAWKDRNKASRANHNRKQGHDRKMARGGALV